MPIAYYRMERYIIKAVVVTIERGWKEAKGKLTFPTVSVWSIKLGLENHNKENRHICFLEK